MSGYIIENDINVFNIYFSCTNSRIIMRITVLIMVIIILLLPLLLINQNNNKYNFSKENIIQTSSIGAVTARKITPYIG